jgi:eukaryotic-like serine/threonine-protein kinase
VGNDAGLRKEPRILGRYAIYDAIASGGMATVYYGRLLGPVGFSRTVAVKRLHPQFAQDPEFVTMFLDEARLAGRIRHPNVVATLDVVANANEIFLVMDYVHGESLARIIREITSRGERVPLPIALRIASDVLLGLHAAHEARDERGIALNIVHRDISPQNILLGVDGTARLVDFGVAKATGQGQTTREGQLKGKLGYMAPEQLRGGKVTRQTDIHAFGIVFWEMLAGHRLFVGENEADTLGRVIHHAIPAVNEIVPGLPAEVDAVIQRGMSVSLEARYATARDMCIALDTCGTMASSMQVADWVQTQAHGLLELRTQVVNLIERSEDPSGPASVVGLEPGTSVTDWVKRASTPDLSSLAKDAETLYAPIAPTTAPETSVSAVLEGARSTRHPRPWLSMAGVVGGVVGVVALFFALAASRNRPAPEAAAASPVAAAPLEISTVAPVPPSTSSSMPAVASASAAPPVVTPASHAGTPAWVKKPHPPPAARHDSVFDSRE